MPTRTILVDAAPQVIEFEREGAQLRSEHASLELISITTDEVNVLIGGRNVAIPYFVSGAEIFFSFDGETYTAEVMQQGSRTRTRHREQSTSAPMPGLVLKVLVESGDVVEKGAPLIILEAMKMEHTINAPRGGSVVAIHCREGEPVQAGLELVEIKE